MTHREAEDAKAERERDLDRLLTFVDAIVAIAITLLVLPLAELATHADDYDTVGSLLREHSEELWSFVLSFYVIARLWMSQHHAVSPLLVGNTRIVGLLIAWTFTIVVVPFPTSLVAVSGHDAVTKVLYVGTMATSIGIIGLLRVEIGRHPELTDGTPYAGPVGGLVTAGLMLLALMLMLTVPSTSYFPMLLLVLDGPLLRLVDRNRSAA